MSLSLVLIAAPPAERGVVAFVPLKAEASVPERFRLEAAEFHYELEGWQDAGLYTVERLRFPSPIVTPDEANNTVHAEYFRPKSPGKHPGVVVLHILGADFPLSRYLAARLAERGVAALFVKLPYYGERRPVGGEQRLLSANVDRSVLSMRQGVLDVRRAATWLASRPDVEASRLGVTGISLGGIVSSLVASVDPSIHRAALVMAGGNLAEALWSMPESRKVRELWISAGRTKAQLIEVMRPVDPLTTAAGLIGKRVVMFAGNADEVIPPDCTRVLWEAAGRPPIRWYDCGHYSVAGFLLPAIREVVDFFADEPPSP
ncbi:alpha/beta hydrolase family protein [Isosphaeraceae bacterium EP7]